MKRYLLTLVGLLGLGSMAAAQERLGLEPSGLVERETEAETASLPDIDRGTPELPRSLSQTPVEEPDDVSSPPSLAEMMQGGGPETLPLSLGASAGYLRAKDTDHGTWFGGVQARLRLGIFAAEASIQFHQNRYQHGAVVVTQYPVQLTAFLYILPAGPIRPYIL
ncbi:MAG TPA: hypothetical protein VKW04_15625, partial [Planctomycetota bacterium]|nr:hypothetical protein [Planctomycetota bacterium]